MFTKKEDTSQMGRFKDVAPDLQANGDEANFNEKLRKMVKQRPDEKEGDDDE